MLGFQLCLFGQTLLMNYVRHVKMPAAAPKSAFLTVHTLAWQAVGTGLAVLGLPFFDSFNIALGVLLFVAYYALVHEEEQWTHLVHFPTAFIPVLSAAAKTNPRTTPVWLAVGYAVAYALYVNSFDAPYAFMRRLRRHKGAFWTAGVLLVIPLMRISNACIPYLAAQTESSLSLVLAMNTLSIAYFILYY